MEGTRPTVVRGLAEIALRVRDLDAMQDFYERVVGLELLRRFDQHQPCAFFRIAEGAAGHTQVLALFDRSSSPGYVEPDGERSTVDHIAFEISRDDYAAERERLEALGLEVEVAYHEWVSWRSLYVRDPEGNLVEWVCHDPAS